MSIEVMRDRKASHIASAWIAFGGTAAELAEIVQDAEVGMSHPRNEREVRQAARVALADVLRVASAMRTDRHLIWPDASYETWNLAVHKVKLQESVSV